MAMDPNKNNSSSSNAINISPPLTGGQTSLLDPSSRWNDDKIDEEQIRRIIREEMYGREELGKKSHYNLSPPRLLPNQNIHARYQLQFINKVKDPTFTTDLVRDEIGEPIKVAIHDTYTQSITSPDNILSSAKVRITVLNAEFWENKGETWSCGEFNQSVLRERVRERKGPILTSRGLIIQLEKGVGTFENIVFNDNSSWTKSGFRLGVVIVDEGEEGYLNGERVREGVSESFRVKDRRVKASQKPDLLKLTHSIQCIKKIGKGRASFLEKKKINTVEDFLKLYYNDEPALREILCIKSESGKEWESMIAHATQCADEFHAKHNVSHPMVRNKSLCTNGGLHVVGSGSSEPNPSENKIIEGALNEHISTASVERIVETQPAIALETNRTNVERGNILNGNSVHRTNGVDAESSPNYNTQVRLGGGSGCYRPRRPPPSSYQPGPIIFTFYYRIVINNFN
ncbi:calmodulin-binding protein 60 B-like [Carex rostrata]